MTALWPVILKLLLGFTGWGSAAGILFSGPITVTSIFTALGALVAGTHGVISGVTQGPAATQK